MATREITIRFMTPENKAATGWSHTYTAPAGLVVTSHEASSPAYQQLFRRTMHQLMPQYQAECDAKAGRTCINCRGRTGTAVLTPISYLHLDPPLIQVLVSPICGLPMCRKAAEVMVQDIMEEMNELDMNREIKCEAEGCGNIENIKRCGKCKVIGYCGTACQKKDWKEHKKICAQLAASREAGGRA